MATTTERLAFILTASGTQAVSEFEKVGAAANTNLRTAEDKTRRLGEGLTRAGAGFLVFGGLAVAGLAMAAKAADEEQLATQKLNTAFANSPVAAGQSTAALIDQAQALQSTTKYADDATIGMQAMLATFRLNADQIQQLTPLVQDLASFWGMDLESAAKAVGKAVQGNIGALQRQGIVIDEARYSSDRFGAVMDALRENAGGFAEQEGRTFAGQVEILKNNIGDLAEGIGSGALPIFQRFIGMATDGVGAIKSLDAVTHGTIGTIGAWAGVSSLAVGSILLISGQVLKLKASMDLLRETAAGARIVQTFGSFGGAAAVLATGVGLAVGAVKLFGDNQQSAVGDVDALSAALDRQNDKIGENTEEWLSNTLLGPDASDGLTDLAEMMDNAGKSIMDLNRALAGGQEDVTSFFDELKAGNEGLSGFDLNDADNALEGLMASFRDADQANRLAEGLSAAGRGADDLSEGASDAFDAVENLTGSIDRWVERVQGIEASRDDVQAAFQDLYETLLTNGQAWRGDTEKARENREAMRGLVEQSAAYITTLVEQGASEGRLQAVKARTIARLRQARDAGILSADAFRVLRTRIDGIPGTVPIHIDTNVEFVRREFQLLQGDIANAGAVAAGHSAEFHGVGVTAPTVGGRSAVDKTGGDRRGELRQIRRDRKQRRTPQLVIPIGGR
jgi:hypothetical protein